MAGVDLLAQVSQGDGRDGAEGGPLEQAQHEEDDDVVRHGVSAPSTVAAMSPMAMAGTRPMRSATIDHGITAAARPIVDADTVSAAPAGGVPTSAEIAGRSACVEYSCAKVPLRRRRAR